MNDKYLSPELLNAVVRLRANALLRTPFVKSRSERLKRSLENSCGKRLEAALQSGGLIDCARRGGKISAVLTLHTDNESIPGVSFPHLNIDYLNTPKGRQEAKFLLRRNHHHLKNGTVCFALSSMPAVQDLLAPLGFGVEYVVLLGPVREGLDGLLKRYAPPSHLNHLNLEIVRIRSTKEIDTVMRIFKQEFGRNPQYGRWAGNPKYLTCIRKSMGDALKKKKLDGFLIRRNKKILGYFGYYVVPSGPIYPSAAGVEIILSQKIQGLGIAKTCYRLMLEELRRRRVALIRGGTSQPAVMGIGKALKRRPFAYMMLRGSRYFDADHFSLKGCKL